MPHAAPHTPGVKACCQIEANLKEIERRLVTDGKTGAEAGALVTYQCQICRCRHYVHEIAPIVIDVAGKNM